MNPNLSTPRLSGISLLCALKNRSSILNHSILSWLVYEEIQEIIIVDWSSDIPVQQELQIKDNRIKIFRVEEQAEWNSAKAYNLAARLAAYDLILKIDSDDLLLNNFFEIKPEKGKNFYAGNWSHAYNNNQKSLNGICFLTATDFFTANGYNELINTYGWEDDDFYNRLNINLERKSFNLNNLYHLPHSDHLRTINQKHANNPIRSIRKNMIKFGINLTWSKKSKMSEYSTISNNPYVLIEKNENL